MHPFHFLSWLKRRKPRCAKGPGRRTPPSRTLRLDLLEDKIVPTTLAYNPLTYQPSETGNGPLGISAMMLRPDGVLEVQGGGVDPVAGNYGSAQWYAITPDAAGGYVNGTGSISAAMANFRLDYGSNILSNGNIFVEGGEHASQTFTNAGEIYNSTANSWTATATFKQSLFGDDPTVLLPSGQVLAGYFNGPQTYLYTPATSTTADRWDPTGNSITVDGSPALGKLYNDQSDEESWALLPGTAGDVLSYDIWSSASATAAADHTVFQAQVYVPAGNAFPWDIHSISTGQWIDASHPDAVHPPTDILVQTKWGRQSCCKTAMCWSWGRTGQPTTTTRRDTPPTAMARTAWEHGPALGLGRRPLHCRRWAACSSVAEDDPAAVLPNGKVLMALSAEGNNSPTYLYEFDPSANPGTTNPYTRLDSSDPTLFPADLYSELQGASAFQVRMLVLPTGEVAMSFIDNTEMWAVSDSSGAAASVPALSGPPSNTNSIYSLSGAGLTGLSEAPTTAMMGKCPPISQS